MASSVVSFLVCFLAVSSLAPLVLGGSLSCSECDYVFPAATTSNKQYIDNDDIGVPAGGKACFDTSLTYVKGFVLSNFVGDSWHSAITFTNCGGGVANFELDNEQHGLEFHTSQFIRVSGSGDDDEQYGIRINLASKGVSFVDGTTYLEVERVEILNGFGHTALEAKSDPDLYPDYVRGKFTMREIYVHDNYFHETGTEAIYIGYYDYEAEFVIDGQTVQPHLIETVHVYNNFFENTAWDGIQIGHAVKDVIVAGNYILNYATEEELYQTSGMHIQAGTKDCKIYSNYVQAGAKSHIAILVQNAADTEVYNNVVNMLDAESGTHYGISASFPNTKPDNFGTYATVSHNTVINPTGSRGINWYYPPNQGYTPIGTSHNNLVVYGGSASWECVSGSYEGGNNVCSTSILNEWAFKNNEFNFHMKSSSTLRDAGADIGDEFPLDFDCIARPKSGKYDVGAYQYTSTSADKFYTMCSATELVPCVTPLRVTDISVKHGSNNKLSVSWSRNGGSEGLSFDIRVRHHSGDGDWSGWKRMKTNWDENISTGFWKSSLKSAFGGSFKNDAEWEDVVFQVGVRAIDKHRADCTPKSDWRKETSNYA